MGDLMSWLAGVVLFGIVVFLMYWVGKNLSYMIFYESMVQDTIREMVRQGALIK